MSDDLFARGRRATDKRAGAGGLPPLSVSRLSSAASGAAGAPGGRDTGRRRRRTSPYPTTSTRHRMRTLHLRERRRSTVGMPRPPSVPDRSGIPRRGRRRRATITCSILPTSRPAPALASGSWGGSSPFRRTDASWPGVGRRSRGQLATFGCPVVDLATGQVRETQIGQRPVFAHQLAWSPDGRLLAWSGASSGLDGSDLRAQGRTVAGAHQSRCIGPTTRAVVAAENATMIGTTRYGGDTSEAVAVSRRRSAGRRRRCRSTWTVNGAGSRQRRGGGSAASGSTVAGFSAWGSTTRHRGVRAPRVLPTGRSAPTSTQIPEPGVLGVLGDGQALLCDDSPRYSDSPQPTVEIVTRGPGSAASTPGSSMSTWASWPQPRLSANRPRPSHRERPEPAGRGRSLARNRGLPRQRRAARPTPGRRFGRSPGGFS